MNDDLIVQRLQKSFRDMDDQARHELWAELQRRGVIDAEGRVLKRAPEPPEAADNGKKKPTRSRKNSRRSSRG